ncbi:hypothetical protein FGKAn22_16120 [Ferrigenium kumadai]|uniref:DUF3617 family protein n=1 Tax=Ferrigenium kumadai TaxID=1682490 RepID=A0AAN1VZY9_9PROT|nr:DUF3617 family protein [Ferrigenium kumadai]BBI99919.1 hypothetical protein FGKAn22_16120 [Ferrigenium kumadai]
MKKTLPISLALLWGAFAPAAFAEQGEWWEISSKTEMPDMPFSIPATTTRVCLAKATTHNPPQAMQDKTCKMTNISTSGNKTTWKMHCVRNGEVTNGSGEFTGTPDNYQGVTRLSGTTGGNPVNMTSTYRGKRVGPACDTSQLPQNIGGKK